ncbi:hypothetical protein Tco_0014405 [Tanacetum coccineum]
MAEMQRGLDQLMERKEGGCMYLLWVSLIGDVRTLMMDEAHASRYLVHSGANKTYYGLRDMYGSHVDKTLRFAKEPVDIIGREVKSLKCSRIPIVKSRDEISLRRGYCDNYALSRYHQEELYTHKEEMAFSDSDVHNDKPCTISCLKNYETLMKQNDDLLSKLHQTEFKASTFKRGLDTVEAQLVTYRKNEVLFSEEVVVLKREVRCKQYEINMLKTECEKVKQEKEGINFKIEKFENASKDLDKLLGSQITDNSKKGFGYHAVPPPHPLIYNAPTKLDSSYSGLDEFKEPKFKGYGLRANKSDCEISSNETKKNSDAPLIEEWVSNNEDEVESPVVVEKKTVVPTIPKVDVIRPKQQQKPVRKTVRFSPCRDSDESGVTYTEKSSTFEELSDIGSPGVVPSSDYIPGPEEPQLPPPLDYVLEPIYPEYMPQEDEVFLAEEQPLPAAASPTAQLPDYVLESDPEADPEEDDDEDPEEDPVDYPDD